MSSQNVGQTRTFKAGADLSAKQYFIVALDASNQNEVILANAQTLPTLGILQNAPEDNDVATVHLAGSGGTSKLIASGQIAVGAYVTADSAGKAVATTTNGDFVIGRVVKGSSTDGDTIEVQVLGFRY